MPSFTSHHCPICYRVGDKRCIQRGHFIECPEHPGSFHSKITECIKCVAATKRETLPLEDAGKENQPEGAGVKKQKKAKIKPVHEKTVKQLRKEKREQRRSSGN